MFLDNLLTITIFAPLVFAHPNDSFCQQLLTEAGSFIDRYIAYFKAQNIHRVTLVGGIASAITPWLSPSSQSQLTLAQASAEEGAILIGVQDASATMMTNEGINPDELLNHCKQNKGSIAGFPKVNLINAEDFFSQDCDIIIPAALGNQITVDNAPFIKAELIAEGANGPTTVDAEEILLERGVEIIPDILCNSGGVTGSYYEWLQNKRSENWKIEDVLVLLEDKIAEAFDKTLKTANQFNTDWRTSAYIVALQRLEQTYKERGVFP